MLPLNPSRSPAMASGGKIRVHRRHFSGSSGFFFPLFVARGGVGPVGEQEMSSEGNGERDDENPWLGFCTASLVALGASELSGWRAWP